MSLCSLIENNLVPIGLCLNIAGSLVLIGYRLPVLRSCGFALYPTHRRRVSALKKLIDGEEVDACDRGFDELREVLYEDEFVDSQAEYGGEMKYEKFMRKGDSIILHLSEVGDNVFSGYNGCNLRRSVSGTSESVERTLQQKFLYTGAGFLLVGFVVQLVASLQTTV